MERSHRIDALRGLAVFGILLVNGWGFVYGYTALRFGVLPETASAADQFAVFFSAAFAEQKFYPIFSFLFGAGFALQTRSLHLALGWEAARAAYRRRLQWLLVCGLLHALLLWLGDILVAYAVAGFWLLHVACVRLAALWRTFKLLLAINGGLLMFTMLMQLVIANMDLHEHIVTVVGVERAHALYTLGSWSDIALARLIDFATVVASFPFFLPRLALFFLCGVFAVRLGWLTRPGRHRILWRRILIASLLIALPLNLVWGAATLALALDPYASAPWMTASAMLSEVAGPALGAGYIAAFMLAAPRLMAWLEPVGRMALSNYLMQSLLCAFLLQGQGLGLGASLSHASLLAYCFSVMLFQLLFSHFWLSRHAQGPMEALWRRHTAGGKGGARLYTAPIPAMASPYKDPE
jgi:uncharacterized protein